jgi:hypothetical protein
LLPGKEPAGYYSNDWGAKALLLSLAVAHAAPLGRPTLLRGMVHIPWGDLNMYPGNLTVDGSLHVAGNLIVLGDLHVTGALTDAQGANVIVIGATDAENYVLTEGFFFLAKILRAPFVHLDFNQGFAKLLGGIEAKVLLENDHGGSRIFGPVEVGFLSYDELTLDDPRPASSWEDLKPLLRRELHKDAQEACESPYDLGSLLSGHLKNGEEVFVSGSPKRAASQEADASKKAAPAKKTPSKKPSKGTEKAATPAKKAAKNPSAASKGKSGEKPEKKAAAKAPATAKKSAATKDESPKKGTRPGQSAKKPATKDTSSKAESAKS